MLRGSLLTVTLVELFGEIAARWREGARRGKKTVASLDPFASFFTARRVRCRREEAEL